MTRVEDIWPEWHTEEPLGSGAYGSVWRATRTFRGRVAEAAIKVIDIPQSDAELANLEQLGMDEESLRTFLEDLAGDVLDEVAAMEALKGARNIVAIEDFRLVNHTGDAGCSIGIRMELLEALPDYWKRVGEPDAREVARVGMDVCRALEVCHAEGIVHRDVKPQNIFVSRFGDYKLGDFGIARSFERGATTVLSQRGTRSYMAPEVFYGRRYGSSVDLYSLGLMLYRCLNGGRGPFLPPAPARVTPQELYAADDRRMRGETLPAPAGADSKLASIVLKACAPVPQDRWTSARRMREALEAWLEGQGAEGAPAGVAAPVEPVAQPPQDPTSLLGPKVETDAISVQVDGMHAAGASLVGSSERPVTEGMRLHELETHELHVQESVESRRAPDREAWIAAQRAQDARGVIDPGEYQGRGAQTDSAEPKAWISLYVLVPLIVYVVLLIFGLHNCSSKEIQDDATPWTATAEEEEVVGEDVAEEMVKSEDEAAAEETGYFGGGSDAKDSSVEELNPAAYGITEEFGTMDGESATYENEELGLRLDGRELGDALGMPVGWTWPEDVEGIDEEFHYTLWESWDSDTQTGKVRGGIGMRVYYDSAPDDEVFPLTLQEYFMEPNEPEHGLDYLGQVLSGSTGQSPYPARRQYYLRLYYDTETNQLYTVLTFHDDLGYRFELLVDDYHGAEGDLAEQLFPLVFVDDFAEELVGPIQSKKEALYAEGTLPLPAESASSE